MPGEGTAGRATDARRMIGLGLVCMSLLSFEILTSQVLSVVVAPPTAIMAIAFAMLGMGAAASLGTLAGPGDDPAATGRRHRWLLAGLAVLLAASFLGVSRIADAGADGYRQALADGGIETLVSAIRVSIGSQLVLLAVILSLPYILFGFWISDVFRRLPDSARHRYYGADLIGAAAGCVLMVVVLDRLSFSGGLGLVLSSCIAGALLLDPRPLGRPALLTFGALALAALAVIATPLGRQFEPVPSLDRLARNFELSRTAEVEWHVWNSQSRVARLRIEDDRTGAVFETYAHQNGEGWASVPDPGATAAGDAAPSTSRLATIFDPQRVLVLFAGVGNDMVQIDADCGGRCFIEGVEINRQMVEHAIATDPALAAFLARDTIRLTVVEAREFIGRTDARYDSILLSWWGAGLSHSVGTASTLAEGLYTREAFTRLTAMLSEGGTIVIYNGSKLEVLLTLRAMLGGGPIRDKVIVLSPDRPDGLTLATADRLRLLFRPAGFAPADEARVLALARDLGMSAVLTPQIVGDEGRILARIADGEALASINADLVREAGIELSVVTDNWPYLNNVIPGERLLRPFAGGDTAALSGTEALYRLSIQVTLMIAYGALLVIIAPLLLRSGPARTRDNMRRLGYFACIGLGFMLVEVGFVRKFGLLLGHPSLAIAVVLAAMILFTGLGSMFQPWIQRRLRLGERGLALAIAGACVGLVLVHDLMVPALIGLPVIAKSLLVAIGLALPGLLMGQLFPMGLANAGAADPRLVSWAWAINATASTIGVMLAFCATWSIGIDELIFAGAAVYLLLPRLPRALPG